MKKLWLLVSVSAALMAVKCPKNQSDSKASEETGASALDTVEQVSTAIASDTLVDGRTIHPADSLADGGIISPNHSPNQEKLDSIKKEKAKEKKKHSGGKGDNN